MKMTSLATPVLRWGIPACVLVVLAILSGLQFATSGFIELPIRLAGSVALAALPFVGRWALPEKHRPPQRGWAAVCLFCLWGSGFLCGNIVLRRGVRPRG